MTKTISKIILCLLSIFLIVGTVTVLTGCKVDPQNHEWIFEEARAEHTFINGVRKQVSFRPYLLEKAPFSAKNNEEVYIRFDEDGVIFKPVNDREYKGTYKCEKDGLFSANITITLQNGETIYADMSDGALVSRLYFEYRGGYYKFVDEASRTGYTKEDLQEDIGYLINKLRREFYRAEQTVGAEIIYDGGYKLRTNDGEIINLSSEDIGVCAMKLTENNELIDLDALQVGECRAAIGYSEGSLSYQDFITIYYIEPFWEDLKPITDQLWFPENDDVVSITLRIYDPSETPNETVRTIEDREEIEAILEKARGVTLMRIPSEFVTFSDYIYISFSIETKEPCTVGYPDVCDGLVDLGSSWWRVSCWDD